MIAQRLKILNQQHTRLYYKVLKNSQDLRFGVMEPWPTCSLALPLGRPFTEKREGKRALARGYCVLPASSALFWWKEHSKFQLPVL